ESGVPFWQGRQLVGRPEHEVFARLEGTRFGGRVFYEFEYTSGNYLDRPNREPVGPRRIHNLGAGRSFARDLLRLTAELRNLSNDQVEDAAGYPLPGRTFAITAGGKL